MEMDIKISMSAARINAGLSQTQAAKKLNITRETLGAWEKGRAVPRVDQACRMAELYDVPFDNIKFF